MRCSLALALALLPGPGCIDTQLHTASTKAAVNPDFVDLGTVAVAATQGTEISVASVGLGTLTVVSLTLESIGSTDAFEIDGELGGTTLAKGTALAVPVFFTPPSIGQYEADLVIQTDANSGTAAFTVHLRGVGAEPSLIASPSILDFGGVLPGADAFLSLTVQNIGGVSAQVITATLAGDPTFYLSNVETPLDVAAGADGSIAVGFGAADIGEQHALLTLTTNDPDLGTLTVPILANACAGDSAVDADSDGISVCAGDCDDSRADVAPGGVEALDGRDNDCDAVVDEETDGYDDDGDGYTEEDGDCADADTGVAPSAVETQNGIDDDCDGIVDEGTDAYDDDGDGFTEEGGDCDDADARTSPGAAEVADREDDDCDGVIDNATSASDDDGDGVTESGGDCDDGNADIFPGASEAENGADDNCDGTVDEGTDAFDDDGDGYTEDGGDCNDASGTIGPHRLEVVGDGIDNDCNGSAS